MTAQDLKNSILQRAMQGKLVKQRDDEGTAAEFLIKIKAEKDRLIKEGKIKKEKPLSEISEDEIPFDIPDSWEWVRVPYIITLIQGVQVPIDKQKEAAFDNSVPFLRIINFTQNSNEIRYVSNDYIKECALVNPDTLVMVRYGATSGNIYDGKIGLLANNLFIINTVSNNIYKAYIKHYFMTSAVKYSIISDKSDTAMPSINFTAMNKLLIPIPPYAEQKRIVAKIEELMPLVEQYGKAYDKLTQLNNKFPEDMRKSILQYAMQGKLVEQRAEEGTAEELLKIIDKQLLERAEQGLEKYHKIRDVGGSIEPFSIPDSWKWVYISDMSIFQEGPGILAIDFRSKGVPLIRIAGMQGDILSLEGCNYLDENMVNNRWSHFRLDVGDIVISTSASMDKICEVDEMTAGAIPYTGQIRFKMLGEISKEFFKWFIKSPCYMKQIDEQKKGGMIKHYGPSHLRKMVIPIPPLAEQHRIVEAIENLMPYCRQLSK